MVGTIEGAVAKRGSSGGGVGDGRCPAPAKFDVSLVTPEGAAFGARRRC